jgi:hypothetical protein
MSARIELVVAAVSGMLAGCRGADPDRPVTVATDDDAVVRGEELEPAVPVARPADPEVEVAQVEDKDCCKGRNECKGLGSCKTDRNDCAGQNWCKGQGGCKPSVCPSRQIGNCCAGRNDCKGLGNCKTSQHGCAGLNECKGQGGCRGPSCP